MERIGKGGRPDGSRRAGLILAGTAAVMLWGAPAAAQPIGKMDLGKLDFGSRTDHDDGSAAISIGRVLATTFDARAGLDWTAAPARQPDRLHGRPVPTVAGDASSGAAWMNVTLPGWGWDKTVIEARLHPFQDHGRIGAVASRKVPIGNGLAMTVDSAYALTHQLGAGAAASAAPVVESHQRVGVNILPTATTIAVSRDFSSAHSQWRSAVSAEQALFGGPVSLSAGVSETDSGRFARSIGAAFRRQF